MSASAPLRLVILISGRGSNMAAIAEACAQRRIHAVVTRVICDQADAAGLDRAQQLGIPTTTVARKRFADRSGFEDTLAQVLDAERPDLIVLAGFMRILSGPFVARYAGRMLNIHPSLLPKYRGLNTHRRVLDSGDPQHGASVHLVTAELDGGPLIMQARIAVRPGESAESLLARVQAMEHQIYPQVIGLMAQGRLKWDGERMLLDGRALSAPIAHDEPATPAG